MENQQHQQSEIPVRSGGILISYRILAGLILLVVLIVGSAFYVSKAGSAKPCDKVYQTERAIGPDVDKVRQQFISEGWSLEDYKLDSEIAAGRIMTFSRCK